MHRLVPWLVGLVMLTCGKSTPQGSEGQTAMTPAAKRALDALGAELVDNGGLVIEDVRIEADSIRATVRLTPAAVKAWEEVEGILGRAPSVPWVTVSVQLYRGGELVGKHSVRLGQVRALSPTQPTLHLALARRPTRSGTPTAPPLPTDAHAECTVLGVRVQ